ncbi:MAG: Hsp33 family molecular chaperone HslO [Leptospirales bacterium]|nr:Hsp33 family molecular chaperone HslO [Leptospirales bacterium]
MDAISRLICDELKLRVYTVTSVGVVKKLCKIHNTSPTASRALGGTINAALLAGASLKPGSAQSVSVKFSGNGPLQSVQAQVDAKGNVRGYVSNPDIDELTFSKAIGAGFLSIERDLNLKNPYTSLLPLVYGNIAADMSYFFTSSEQIPSAMILALEMNDKEITASGGILIQTFPDTPESSIALAENSIQNMKKSLGQSLFEGADIAGIASSLLGNFPLTEAGKTEIQLRCRCSKDMLTETIKGFHREEITQMIEEDRGAEIVCSFCKNIYRFNEDELTEIMNKKPTH